MLDWGEDVGGAMLFLPRGQDRETDQAYVRPRTTRRNRFIADGSLFLSLSLKLMEGFTHWLLRAFPARNGHPFRGEIPNNRRLKRHTGSGLHPGPMTDAGEGKEFSPAKAHDVGDVVRERPLVSGKSKAGSSQRLWQDDHRAALLHSLTVQPGLGGANLG